jgi:Arabinose-binding domain of AraC transcription regulator, N-term
LEANVPSAPELGALIDEGQHRVGVLMEVPLLLVELGREPNAVIRAAGISPDQLQNPEGAIALAAACRRLRLCAEAADCPHFGALVGRHP